MFRKHELFEKFNKRTEEFKVALKKENVDIKKKTELFKYFSSYFMLENMLEIIRSTAERGTLFL